MPLYYSFNLFICGGIASQLAIYSGYKNEESYSLITNNGIKFDTIDGMLW